MVGWAVRTLYRRRGRGTGGAPAADWYDPGLVIEWHRADGSGAGVGAGSVDAVMRSLERNMAAWLGRDLDAAAVGELRRALVACETQPTTVSEALRQWEASSVDVTTCVCVGPPGVASLPAALREQAVACGDDLCAELLECGDAGVCGAVVSRLCAVASRVVAALAGDVTAALGPAVGGVGGAEWAREASVVFVDGLGQREAGWTYGAVERVLWPGAGDTASASALSGHARTTRACT